MRFTRYIILLFVFFFSNTPDSISQKKSTVAVAEDIFSDLPINNPSTNSILKAGESGEEKIKKNIFVSGSFNKATCYVGEPILLSFELLSALKSKSTVLRLPSFDGFTPIMMDPDNSFPKFRKQNNIEYSVFAIKQVQLLPDKEGSFEIGPILLNNTVVYKKDNKEYSYAGTVSSKSISLKVKQLPLAGRPANFDGVVGDFTIKSFAKTDSFPVGENNTLTIEVDGAGNFYSLKIPPVYWPTGFHNFDISEKDDLDQKLFPVKGKKTISIPFIAEQQGAFIIPPVELNFFDPVSATYRKSFTTAIRLMVTPPLSDQKNTTLSVGKSTGKPQKNYYWLYITIACILVPVLVFYAIKQFRKNEIKKQQLAIESQKKHEEDEIKKAHQEKIAAATRTVAELDNSKLDDKYVFTFKKALIDYLHLKLNIADALPEELAASITAIDQSAGIQLKQLLEECDLLLYSSIPPDEPAREKMLGLLHGIIEKVDQYHY